MPRPPSKHPTELELEILKALWRDGTSTVREVREAISGFRDLAYTSVMTIMGIMTDKGYLRRHRKGKSYVYTPAISEEETTQGMLGDIVERVYDGSAKAAMIQLLEIGDLDADELASLKTLIENKSKEGS